MKLDIILRTHDIMNVHNDWRIRYCDLEKHDLVKGCFNSLLKAIDNTQDFIETNLIVLDDHSTDKFIDFLNEKQKTHDFTLHRLEEKGYNFSALKQFEFCRDSEADLVYSVEDDYLHCDTAIQEMVMSYYKFEDKIKRSDIVLYPFNAPEIYDPPTEMSFIVHGSHRHWRTGSYCTQVMMAPPSIFQDNWEPFELLARNYKGEYLRKLKEHEFRYTEDNTICNIWRENKAILFSPIPSIALHMQFDRQLDPYINWEEWWEKYAI